MYVCIGGFSGVTALKSFPTMADKPEKCFFYAFPYYLPLYFPAYSLVLELKPVINEGELVRSVIVLVSPNNSSIPSFEYVNQRPGPGGLGK